MHGTAVCRPEHRIPNRRRFSASTPLTQLKALILNDTSLGDDGVAAVCQALTQPGAAPQLEVGMQGSALVHAPTSWNQITVARAAS